MKHLFFIILVLICFQLEAQKIVEKSINAESIACVVVEGDGMFKIKIKTANTSSISIKTKIEGENSQHMVVSSEIKNDSLIIKSAYQPMFIGQNDKLSAHKVMSIELELSIPKHLSLYVKSDNASASINGTYNNITVELSQGNCMVNNFLGNATINTINGKIDLESNYATVSTYSKTGSITKRPLLLGENQISLHTINGDISVTKTKK